MEHESRKDWSLILQSAEISKEQWRDLVLSIKTHRKSRRLHPYEISLLLEQLSQVISLNEISSELGLRDATVLRRFMSLLKLPDEIQPLVGWGQENGYISFSVASEIARLNDNPLIIRTLAKDALENQRTREEEHAIVQCIKQSSYTDSNIKYCIETINKLRPIIVNQYAFLGKFDQNLNNDRNLDDLYETKLRQFLEDSIGPSNVISVSVKGNRFSLLLTEAAVKSSDFSDDLTAERVESFITRIISD